METRTLGHTMEEDPAQEQNLKPRDPPRVQQVTTSTRRRVLLCPPLQRWLSPPINAPCGRSPPHDHRAPKLPPFRLFSSSPTLTIVTLLPVNSTTMANGRSSQDERKLENGAPAAPASDGIHPAFYIAYVFPCDLSNLESRSNLTSTACGLL